MSLFKKKMNDEIFIASFNRSNATVTDSELTEVFSEVGSRYGYADVKAKFKALKDFKVQWQRSYKWAEFTVSDYMDRTPVPEIVLEHGATTIFHHSHFFIDYTKIQFFALFSAVLRPF